MKNGHITIFFIGPQKAGRLGFGIFIIKHLIGGVRILLRPMRNTFKLNWTLIMTDNLEGKKSRIFQSIYRIISGFLTGIGFSIALIIVLVLAGYVWDYNEKEAKTEKNDIDLSSFERYKHSFIEYDENSGLVIENHEFRKSDTKLTIIGQIKNIGQENWERTHIEVELFDSSKKFVDQCSGLAWGTIKPNQTRNFKVICGGCDNEPLVEFSTYEIRITDASHKRMD